ncbi:MAG: hypothetical protein RML93_12840 [Anaerolineales bacterium]|nr:hypothetical protein [Anaerolineales bacterium]MDW8448162.1 hypothetical protein [Anaerolineales bacterium]
MVIASTVLKEGYWELFELKDQDIEYLYNYLLESETPLTTTELLSVLIEERFRQEKLRRQMERGQGCDLYLPRERYQVGQRLVFPALGWKKGVVVGVRVGRNPDLGPFEVIKVEFDQGETREFAAALDNHPLNQPPRVEEEEEQLDLQAVLDTYGDLLSRRVEEGLREHADFVQIAGKWFPRALLVDINMGHLNLAEAVLDMAGGGPLPTAKILEQIELQSNVNPKLLEFSLNYALQEDDRFDEVGAAGEVLWFLRRLEPPAVLEPPLHLRYSPLEEDRSLFTEEMLRLEASLQDELSPPPEKVVKVDEVQIALIYPHWREGTLPLSAQTRLLFPTAYEAPRIRFTIVDGESNERFPAWVVRRYGYVYGLKEWYEKRSLIPGSLVKIQRGKNKGEVLLTPLARRPGREWVRTVLVGSDGGVVFAMLKHHVATQFDERMAIIVPDVEGVDRAWERILRERIPFEKVVVNMVRELSKLNPQGHVHATELYAAVNILRRSPPGPILSLLNSRSYFVHVGDQYYRYVEGDESSGEEANWLN